MKMKILVKCEETGKVERIEIDEDKQVFDVLKLLVSVMNFDKDSVLCVRKEGDHNYLHEAMLLSELKDVKMLLVSDKHSKINEKEKNDARDKENLKTSRRTRENVEKKMNESKTDASENDFAKRFEDITPTQNTDSSNVLDLHSKINDHNTTPLTFQDTNEDEELIILRKKIKSEGLDGFVYEIISANLVDHNESSYLEFSFSSEEERRASQSKTCTVDSWSSWMAEGGFSAWGVSVSASAGKTNRSRHNEGIKNKSSKKSCTAIVTRTCLHQMKKFRVKVSLNRQAVNDAKKILEADIQEKRQSIEWFYNKYCNFIYTGMFSGGGWFRTVANATSTETMDFTALKKEASARTDTHWEASANGYGASAGGGQAWGSDNQSTNQTQHENINKKVYVTIKKESAPGNTSSEGNLENKIKNPKNWTIFPSMGDDKDQFTPIYKIISTQALEEQDEELAKVSQILRMYTKVSFENMHDLHSPEYVVLLGDVGTGKSTVVEKLTGETERSSAASESFTRTSEWFWTPDGSLIISDTPGSNAMKEKLDHNIEIAAACNFLKVSRIFIIVKAETRIDNVVDNVRKYAERFLDFDMDIVAVLVTHMDNVQWSKKDFIDACDDEVGIASVVFSSLSTQRDVLLRDILKECKTKYDMAITSENFFKLFKIHNNKLKILQCANKEIKRFEALKQSFTEEKKRYSGKDLVDLYFEFQAYMAEEIMVAEKRMAKEMNFTFLGDGAANEAGHVANMVNQLRMVLYDVRTEALAFQSDHGVTELRQCPYCSKIWTKVEGCDGSTICGNRPSLSLDLRDPSYIAMATFTFHIIGGKLRISKHSTKNLENVEKTDAYYGCGKEITWKDMARVDIPPEFREAVKISTDDIKMLPPSADGFSTKVDNLLNYAKDKMGMKPHKK